MADTYSPRLRLAKFETNSHKNTWGADFIDEVLTPVEFSIAGVTTLAMTGDVTLPRTTAWPIRRAPPSST